MKKCEGVTQVSEKATQQESEKIIATKKAFEEVTTQLHEGLEKSTQLAKHAMACYNRLEKEAIQLNKNKLILTQCEKKKHKLKSCVEKYREFEAINSKNIEVLNQKCNDKWHEFEKIWYKWKIEDISMYLKYKLFAMGKIQHSDLCKQGVVGKDDTKSEEKKSNDSNDTGDDVDNIDWQVFDEKLRKDKFKSKYLDRIDKSDLKSYGIDNYQLRNDIYTIIQTLCENNPIPREKPQKNDECKNDCQGQVMTSSNVVDIDSKYLCPLTKKVMTNPVIAFDQHCYEKEAIISYIREHKESPITKEQIDDVEMVIDLFVENKSLKNEIQDKGLL